MKKEKKDNHHKWFVVVAVLLVLGMFSMISAGIIGIFMLTVDTGVSGNGNIAVIAIHGPIVAEGGSSPLGGGFASSSDIIDLIDAAVEDEQIKGILFEINSPGGTAVASYEIVQAISEVNKTTVAWIREIGTSGAYWAASATDYIVASPLSATGSIGVLASYLDFSGFIRRYNITYQRLVAGNLKDTGTPFRELTEEEEEFFQAELDVMHAFFKKSVAQNRGLTSEQIDILADGRFYLGVEAKQNGLIDAVGSKDDAILVLENLTGEEVTLVEFEKSTTLADILSSMFSEQSFFVGKGMGSAMLEKEVTVSRIPDMLI